MSKNSVKIAIITRTKDRPILLDRAIKSVLKQSCKDFIHVIINDGGDKKTVEDLTAKYHDKYDGRLLLIHNKTSLGMEAASNKAIKSSYSKYIVIHDDDDSWHKDFLKKTIAPLEDDEIPDLGGVISFTEKITEDISKDKVKEISREDFNSGLTEVTLWRMCAGNIFPPISFIYKREVLDKIGIYDKNLPVMGDWDFNLRFLRQFEIAIIPEQLAYYHHRIVAANNKSKGKKDDIYANSIINGSNKHNFYSAYLRNKFLRDDMNDKSLGLGYMMNIATNMRLNHENDGLNAHSILNNVGDQITSINKVNSELCNTNKALHESHKSQIDLINNLSQEIAEKHKVTMHNNLIFRIKKLLNKA